MSGTESVHHRSSIFSFRRWARRVRSAARGQVSNPLSRGGLALLGNTVLTGTLGFAYWIIAAHLFSTHAVGIAGALVAATTLFSGIGQLNLSGMLMRFLPKAGGKSRRLVLTTYAFTASTSAVLAVLSLVAIKIFASPTSALRLGMFESAAFVLAVAATAIFTIEDSVLVGLRRAIWVPAENGAFGLVKILALLVGAPIGTAFALYSAWMIPLTLTIPVISAALFLRFLPTASKPRRTANLGHELRSNIVRFAIGDAAGGLFTQTWTNLLPILVTTSLGPQANALFFMSFLISSTMDQVAANFASSLIVEASHAPDKLPTLIRQTFQISFSIILPAVVGLAIMSPWLLRAFGAKYVSAAPLLALLLTACLPKVVSTVYYAYCRIQRRTHVSAITQGCVCAATLPTAILLASRFGLIGVGLAILAVQASTGAFSWWALTRGFHKSGQA